MELSNFRKRKSKSSKSSQRKRRANQNRGHARQNSLSSSSDNTSPGEHQEAHGNLDPRDGTSHFMPHTSAFGAPQYTQLAGVPRPSFHQPSQRASPQELSQLDMWPFANSAVMAPEMSQQPLDMSHVSEPSEGQMGSDCWTNSLAEVNAEMSAYLDGLLSGSFI